MSSLLLSFGCLPKAFGLQVAYVRLTDGSSNIVGGPILRDDCASFLSHRVFQDGKPQYVAVG